MNVFKKLLLAFGLAASVVLPVGATTVWTRYDIPSVVASVPIDSITTPAYTWSHQSNATVSTITSPYFTWQGNVIATSDVDVQPPLTATEQVLELDFASTGYLRDTNIGHFAIALRSKATPHSLEGIGIIIGNVTSYQEFSPSYSDLCTRTNYPSQIAIELFWIGGNCVYGSTTGSPKLKDFTPYRVTVASGRNADGSGYIRYLLQEKVGSTYVWLDDKRVDLGKDVPPYTGWFIGEVFSTHGWTFEFKHVKEYWVTP
jgi:hypothetical protein